MPLSRTSFYSCILIFCPIIIPNGYGSSLCVVSPINEQVRTSLQPQYRGPKQVLSLLQQTSRRRQNLFMYQFKRTIVQEKAFANTLMKLTSAIALLALLVAVAVAIPLADSDNALDADLDLENSASELQDDSNDDDEGTVDLDGQEQLGNNSPSFKCPAGTEFIPSISKPVATSVADCTPCPAGSAPLFAWSGRTGEGCKKCPRGTFAASPGSVKCTSCPTGTIAKHTGSTSCDACPANHASLGITGGSDGGIECLCRRGTFKSSPSECTPCPPGKIADKLGSTSCTDCPPGKQAFGGRQCCEPSKWSSTFGVCRK